MLYRYALQCIFFLFIITLAPLCYAKSPDFISMKVNLDSKKNIGADVEKSIQYLFTALQKGNKNIDIKQISPILDIVESSIASGDVSLRDRNGKGAFLREQINAPIDKVIQYYFSNTIPLEVIHPAGVRSIIPLRGSERIISDDVTSFLERSLPVTKAYIGYDKEETTADLFSGASYSYPIKKMRILLPEYKGKRIALIVNQQTETSSLSTKALILGDDQDWNYIYSNIQGSTDASTGWVKSAIYSSAMILVLVENTETNATEFLLFKWLRAGWLRINVVSSSHIYRGSKRVLYSINKVLSSPKIPSVTDISLKYTEYRKMTENSLRSLLKPYSEKLSLIAQNNPVLKAKDWKPYITDAHYASTLNKTQLVSLLMKNYMKERIGVPIL